MIENSKSSAKQSAATGTGPVTTAASACVADRTLDISTETCPMTFVRTRLALDAMRPGQTLLVRLRGAEPRASVPRTAMSLGHAVLAQDEQPDGSLLLLLQRG